jgi:small neutral amino acid transporter SnatA (MarC family)
MQIDILNSMFVPLLLVFSVIEWLIIFLEIYRHFPKMEKNKRIWNSVVDATTFTFIIFIILYFFMYLLLQIIGLDY